MASLVCLLLALIACGQEPPTTSGVTPYSQPFTDSVFVSFKNTVPYYQALDEITNLGLQSGYICAEATQALPDANGTPVVYSTIWRSADQRISYEQSHILFIDTTYASAPADWFSRLSSAPGVIDAQVGYAEYPHEKNNLITPAPGGYNCLEQAGGTPSAGTPVPLGMVSRNYVIARITFTAPLDSYDAALAAISGVGLGLVDPCYQQALLNNQHPTWHPMGQQATYTSTKSLIVETNRYLTSNLWQRQLQAMPGVAHIEAPYSAHC